MEFAPFDRGYAGSEQRQATTVSRVIPREFHFSEIHNGVVPTENPSTRTNARIITYDPHVLCRERGARVDVYGTCKANMCILIDARPMINRVDHETF